MALFFCFSSAGNQKTIPGKQIRSLVVKAVQLNLTIKQSASDWTIKWDDEFSLQHDETGNLTIQSRHFDSTKFWNQSALTKAPKLEIVGPGCPLKLFAFSLSAVLSQWTGSVFISSFKGKLKGIKNKGPWTIALEEGLTDIDRHKGSILLKGFRVQNTLGSSQGSFQFYLNEGRLEVKKSKGKLSWTTDKAEVKLTQFVGDIQGSSQSGKVRASIKPEKVDLFSREGAMRISFMGQSPAIKAYTERGKIYGARYLPKKFSGKSIEMSGRIKGALKRGDVFLRSDTGNIYIR